MPRRINSRHMVMVTLPNHQGKDETVPRGVSKRAPADAIERKLFKKLQRASLDYNMISPGDHIMVCVSGGKDSATLLWLLLALRKNLQKIVPFEITAVHLDQRQPGYNGAPLEDWLRELGCNYKIVSEDTYSIVKDKTPAGKGYCSLCSRLRRGILYTCAESIGATKLALGHHSDDAAETLFLNMLHQGQMKAMPARYFSDTRNAHVLRPLIYCEEKDIATFAAAKGFPILPCTLCGTQPNTHRGKVKLLLGALTSMNPNAGKNILNAMADVRPSHLLDQGLREACGLDPITGAVVETKANRIHGYENDVLQKQFASERWQEDGGNGRRDTGEGGDEARFKEDADDFLLAL